MADVIWAFWRHPLSATWRGASVYLYFILKNLYTPCKRLLEETHSHILPSFPCIKS